MGRGVEVKASGRQQRLSGRIFRALYAPGAQIFGERGNGEALSELMLQADVAGCIEILLDDGMEEQVSNRVAGDKGCATPRPAYSELNVGGGIARMKILSSDAVIEAAEKAGHLILETYLSPNRTFVDLPDLINEMDPLRDFSEACRRELQSADRR